MRGEGEERKVKGGRRENGKGEKESEKERDEGLVTWVQNPGATGCTIKCSSTQWRYVQYMS